MPLTPGNRIRPFKISAQLGGGGMGEVHRATNANLAGQVAIEVLPHSMAADPERLAFWHRGVIAAAFPLLRIAIALALIAGAVDLVQLHAAVNAQRVHVRYVSAASQAERLFIEQRIGLASGIERDARTWSYILENRSRTAIQALISHPLIEDTHFIDRSRFRVVLDRPDLPEAVRAVAEGEWWLTISALLALGAAAGIWSAWRELAKWSVALWRQPATVKNCLTLVIVGAATALVLPLGVEERPDESMFVHLYEATSILAGDHPYRDFFEWGAPLPALVSAGVQWLVGYRLIGELAFQWAFIVAGVLVAMHLGLRQAQSRLAILAVLPLTLFVVARPGHHFSKLFCIPVGIWFAWRYLDHPTWRRSGISGFVTAIAFLFRHDYGVWAGLSSALAIALAPIVRPESRRFSSFAGACGAYALAVATTLLPWALVVNANGGLTSYIEGRAERFSYERGTGTRNPYAALLHLNPVGPFRTVTLPAPETRVVSFEWRSSLGDSQKRALERQYSLRSLAADDSGRLRYQVSNVYDVRLPELRDQIRNETGFDWRLLDEARRKAPSADRVELWLAQMTMLVPIVLLLSGVVEACRGWFRSEPVRVSCIQRILAGIVLACVDETLFREWSYFVVVAPLTAALSARFIATHSPRVGDQSSRLARSGALGGLARAAAISLLALTTYAASVWRPPLIRESASETARHVYNSMQQWLDPDAYGRNLTYRYLRDCTTERDRLLVAGSTPYYVNYYTHRAMAGGHVDWSLGLLSGDDPEGQSLALLRRQSVPYVVGRDRNTIDAFRRYPRIRAYLAMNYREVDGTDGSILYDTRRPVRTVGPDNLPCFH